jgi:hypothetical protein
MRILSAHRIETQDGVPGCVLDGMYSRNMARLRGQAQKGERLRADIPQGHWKTTTFVAGLRLTSMTAPMVLDGPMNGAAFLAYVQQVLVPAGYAFDWKVGK